MGQTSSQRKAKADGGSGSRHAQVWQMGSRRTLAQWATPAVVSSIIFGGKLTVLLDAL